MDLRLTGNGEGLTNLAHVEGFVSLATHSIQSRVHGAQGHQGLGVCLNLQLHAVPSVILLGTIHVQFQLAEIGSTGQSAGQSGLGTWTKAKSVCHSVMTTGN